MALNQGKKKGTQCGRIDKQGRLGVGEPFAANGERDAKELARSRRTKLNTDVVKGLGRASALSHKRRKIAG